MQMRMRRFSSPAFSASAVKRRSFVPASAFNVVFPPNNLGLSFVALLPTNITGPTSANPASPRQRIGKEVPLRFDPLRKLRIVQDLENQRGDWNEFSLVNRSCIECSIHVLFCFCLKQGTPHALPDLTEDEAVVVTPTANLGGTDSGPPSPSFWRICVKSFLGPFWLFFAFWHFAEPSRQPSLNFTGSSRQT